MRTLFTLIALSISGVAFGQQIHRCATTEAIHHRELAHPGYAEAVNRTFEQAREMARENGESRAGEIYRIPVVVHIVYNTPEENIPDNLVHSQIARLNKDYRRQNEDADETRAEFQGVAADAEIEFYLAGVDPDGNPTGGITRTQTNRTDFSLDLFGGGDLDEVKQPDLGGVQAWDTDNYLNIWVCDLVGGNQLFALFGFAYPPASAPNWPAGSSAPNPDYEGVVVHYEVFGDDNPLASGQLSVSDKGRTAVHEVGHYLGIRHTWGDASPFGGQDGCTLDDGIDDTPNAADNAAQICNFNKNTCTDGSNDLPDMIENYMDYARDECMNLFTQGQVDIMRSMLETARQDLVDGSVTPSSVNELVDASQVAVFPNPASDFIQVQLPREFEIEIIEIFDLNGKLVQSNAVNGAIQSTIIDIDLISGLYILRLSNPEGVINKRVVVH